MLDYSQDEFFIAQLIIACVGLAALAIIVPLIIRNKKRNAR